MFLYQIVLLFRFIISFYHFVLSIRFFHCKTKDLKSIAINFEAINTCLKNITTTSFCFVDTNKKIIIDIEIDDFC